jgi:hypothetical protein
VLEFNGPTNVGMQGNIWVGLAGEGLGQKCGVIARLVGSGKAGTPQHLCVSPVNFVRVAYVGACFKNRALLRPPPLGLSVWTRDG